MKVFVVVASLVVLASARPDAGYSYNRPSGGFSTGGQSGGFSSSTGFGGGSGFSGGSQGGSFDFGGGSGGSFTSGGGGGGGGFVSGGSGGFSSGGGGFSSGGGGFSSGGGFGGGTQITKHIYVHVAPPEPEEQVSVNRIVAPSGPNRKHYKIIFIKAPSPSQQQQVQIAQQLAAQQEEKTLIYVLVKRPDDAVSQDITLPTAAPTPPSKPEVYFIRYKTKSQGGGVGGGISVGGGNIGGGSIGGGTIGSIGGGSIGGGPIASGPAIVSRPAGPAPVYGAP